jgi:hypothetical protein
MHSGKRGGLQHHLVQFTNKDIYFQASSVKATFRDGSHEMFESDSIQYSSTIIGDYLQFNPNHVEFSFWKNAPKGMFDGNQGKLVLKNINMAPFLSPQHNEESLTTFTPCAGTCRAINGSRLQPCATEDYSKYGATIVSFLVAVFITKIASRGPAARSSRYSQSSGWPRRSNGKRQVEGRNDDHACMTIL